jgi:hypothetical protein
VFIVVETAPAASANLKWQPRVLWQAERCRKSWMLGTVVWKPLLAVVGRARAGCVAPVLPAQAAAASVFSPRVQPGASAAIREVGSIPHSRNWIGMENEHVPLFPWRH